MADPRRRPTRGAGGRFVSRAREQAAELEEQQLRALSRVVDRQMMTPAQRAFDAFLGRLGRQVRRETQGRARRRVRNPAEFVSAASRSVRGWADHLEEVLVSEGRLVRTEGVRQVAQYVRRMTGRETHLDDEMVVRRISRSHRESSDRIARLLSRTLGEGMRERVRNSLLLEDLEEMTQGEAESYFEDVVDSDRWRVERIIRTESSRSYNAARLSAIDEIRLEVPGLLKRWTERVSDVTGQPLDDRVGKDSLVLHSQVSEGLFVMPSDPRAPSRMIGQSWRQPPNRPNDRAVILPWAPGWELPAYKIVGGERVALR